jgi:hypothetical protein
VGSIPKAVFYLLFVFAFSLAERKSKHKKGKYHAAAGYYRKVKIA